MGYRFEHFERSLRWGELADKRRALEPAAATTAACSSNEQQPLKGTV